MSLERGRGAAEVVGGNARAGSGGSRRLIYHGPTLGVARVNAESRAARRRHPWKGGRAVECGGLENR